MDIYHVWCNLKPGVRDLEFVGCVQRYLDRLQQAGQLHSYRITRSKLGLKPPQLREFHLMLEFQNLAQLDSAFGTVSARTDPIEGLHFEMNSRVEDIFFALYRDFPDVTRVTGQERF